MATTAAEPSKLISVWTVPRACSTVLERCLANRSDAHHVFHEPLGTPYYFSSSQRGSDRYDTNDAITDDVLKVKCDESMGDVLNRIVSTKTDKCPAGKHVFSKDMAYYLATTSEDGKQTSIKEDLLQQALATYDIHAFLIKNPERQIPSLYKMSTLQAAQTGWSSFDPREVGFREIKTLVDSLTQQTGKTPIIIDADELVANPAGVLEAFCQAMGLPWEPDRMMHWEPADQETVDYFNQSWKGWHDHALASTGWERPSTAVSDKAKSSATTKSAVDIPPEHQSMVDLAIAEALPIYQELFAKRLQQVGTSS